MAEKDWLGSLTFVAKCRLVLPMLIQCINAYISNLLALGPKNSDKSHVYHSCLISVTCHEIREVEFCVLCSFSVCFTCSVGRPTLMVE